MAARITGRVWVYMGVPGRRPNHRFKWKRVLFILLNTEPVPSTTSLGGRSIDSRLSMKTCLLIEENPFRLW